MNRCTSLTQVRIRRADNSLTLGALLAIAYICACATGPQPRKVAAGDLFCERDADCEVVDSDFIGGDCCHTRTEPYAISRAAAERHEARWMANCKGRMCTMECRRIKVTDPADWDAVCSSHICKRRSVKLFPSIKSSCR